MKNLIIDPYLEAFLRKHKCLTVFKKSVFKKRGRLHDGSVKESIKKGGPEAILEAFTWDDSIVPKHTSLNPFMFWASINAIWKSE